MGRGLRFARGEIVRVRLDPTVGSEMQKTRPCVVVSPDDLNAHLSTVIVVPLTSGSRDYSHRPTLARGRRISHLATDQLRAVDRQRVVGRAGALTAAELELLLQNLNEMFAP